MTPVNGRVLQTGSCSRQNRSPTFLFILPLPANVDHPKSSRFKCAVIRLMQVPQGHIRSRASYWKSSNKEIGICLHKNLNLFLPLLTEIQRPSRSRTPTCLNVIMLIIWCYTMAPLFKMNGLWSLWLHTVKDFPFCHCKGRTSHGAPDLPVTRKRSWLTDELLPSAAVCLSWKVVMSPVLVAVIHAAFIKV